MTDKHLYSQISLSHAPHSVLIPWSVFLLIGTGFFMVSMGMTAQIFFRDMDLQWRILALALLVVNFSYLIFNAGLLQSARRRRRYGSQFWFLVLFAFCSFVLINIPTILLWDAEAGIFSARFQQLFR